MSKLIFECHFCKKQFNKQIDLNAHLLFTHFFENPECSLDTPYIIEDYFYSKDKFVKCILCHTNYTDAWLYSTYQTRRTGKYAYLYDQLTERQLQSLRTVENYFCDRCHNKINNEEEAKEKDKQEGNTRNYNLNKYRRYSKRLDGIWQYLQSLPKHRVRLYEKTLDRIHSTNFKLEGV